MPLYEYRCEQCGEQFEVMQKFSDEPLATHEKCGGTVQRLISAPALQFKGSGWYITDYAKSGSAPDNGAAKKSDGQGGTSAASSDSGASSGSSESKPDTKPASTETKTK